MARKKQETVEPKKHEKKVSMEVLQLNASVLEVNLLGMSPLIFNAMSAKAKRNIVLPPPKKSRAEKESTLKHDPMQEYRDSVYRRSGDDHDTRLIFPGGGVKAAIAQAGVDVPGGARATLGRLVQVIETDVSVWGVPQIYMAVVRNAGASRTPDIRTRAILPKWATRFRVRFITPNVTEQAIGNLIAAAGMIVGLGDFRPEKGKGSYGQFRMADADDPELLEVISTGGLKAQDAGLEKPVAYDHETEALLEWFNAEVKRRGFKVA